MGCAISGSAGFKVLRATYQWIASSRCDCFAAIPEPRSTKSVLPLPAREIRGIAGGKRFLERFVHFFFQVLLFIVGLFVRSILAHGIDQLNRTLAGCNH
jgi:hypothetical protein